MSLDIYFPEDLQRVTDALQQSALYQEPGDFRAGWLAALGAVRAAFGLQQETVDVRGRTVALAASTGEAALYNERR